MEQVSKAVIPISVFLSYAPVPEDDALRQKLEKHLRLLQRQGIITTYHHRQILAGADWQRVLDEHLETASIILLLISVDFLDSDYCYGIEMERALIRHRAGEARVIPVLLRPAYLQGAPFGHLLCLPRNGQSVSECENLDKVFQEIVLEIHAAIQDLFVTSKSVLSEKEQKLLAMCADHSGFVHDRLASFVGRQIELEKIRQCIVEKLQTGGYITITGQAGQGKSSIIAKLVENYGIDNAIFHFIPFNPGPDHQVELLRNVMARLILKYSLSDLYVASESRSALRGYFPKILFDIAEKGGQEVIFIDGLDQLKEDADGERDLSFLPNDTPKGIVFVLGTRPNDTLYPLELRKPHSKYELPNLSKSDFDLLLEKHDIKIAGFLVSQLYEGVQENALYLDLVAKELAQEGALKSEEIIKRVSDDPENIFWLSMERLQMKPNYVEWNEVLKPILGVLLVASEPITVRSIGQILYIKRKLEIDEYRIRRGLDRLGGLVANDGRQGYSLFHLKLYNYLQQDESKPYKQYIFAKNEVQEWHKAFINWCENEGLSVIWQDIKYDTVKQRQRDYARRYYISHLYYAGNYRRIFAVLDEGSYGRAKMQYDPSMRLYVRDLELGRNAAMLEEWTTDERIELMEQVWRYTLLECSLTSLADRYPVIAFRVLVVLKREREALGLAELLTDSVRKTEAFIEIAIQLGGQKGNEAMQIALLLRAFEVAYAIEEKGQRARVLRNLAVIFAKLQQWTYAEEIIRTIDQRGEYADALGDLGLMLIKAHQWTQAKAVICLIEGNSQKVKYLRELGMALAEVQQWEQAESIFRLMGNSFEQEIMLRDLGEALIKAQKWEKAKEMISLVKETRSRAKLWRELGVALAKTRQFQQAEDVIYSIDEQHEKVMVLKDDEQHEKVMVFKDDEQHEKVMALKDFAIVLAKHQQWYRAKEIARSIDKINVRAEVLSEIVLELVKLQEYEQAEVVWKEVEATVNFINHSGEKVSVLEELGIVLIKAQQWKRAEGVACSMENGSARERTLGELGIALAKVQQWEYAEVVVHLMKEGVEQTRSLRELGIALAKAQQWERAETVIQSIIDDREKIKALGELSTTIAQMQQWKRAETVILLIKQGEEHERALQELATAFIRAQQWERAETVIQSITHSNKRIRAMQELIIMLIRVQQREWAKNLLKEIEILICSKGSEERTSARAELARALLEVQEWDEAIKVINVFEEDAEKEKIIRQLAVALTEAQQWQQAEGVLRSLKEDGEREKAIRELGTILIEAQQWQQAESVLRSLKEDKKAEALCELAVGLARNRQWEHAESVWSEAEKIIRSIEESQEQEKVLGELGTALIEAEQWQQAEIIIRRIRESRLRAEVLGELGVALIEAEQWEQAEKVIFSLEERELKARVLSELGVALVKAQKWEQAEKVIFSLEERELKARVLSELGVALVKAQQWEQAEKIWAEVELVICSIKEKWKRAKVFGDLCVALVGVQQWQRVKAVISLIRECDSRAEELGELGMMLARAQEWRLAEEVISSLEKRDLKARALSELGVALIRDRQWEQAEMVWAEAKLVISSIEERDLSMETLGELGIALIEAEQWQQAEEVLASLEGSELRTRIIEELGIALISNQQWQLAMKVVHEIEEDRQKIWLLNELGIALTKAQRVQQADAVWEEAEAIIYSLKDARYKVRNLEELGIALTKAQRAQQADAIWEEAEAIIYSLEEDNPITKLLKKDKNSQKNIELSNLAKVFTALGNHKGLLRIIKHSWLQVSTREEAIKILPMAIGFVLYKPELGVAFYEAFAWIDSVLKG